MTRLIMTTSFIDPPSPFDPLEEWQRYLQSLHQLPQTDALRTALIEEAEGMIERKEEEERGRGKRKEERGKRKEERGKRA